MTSDFREGSERGPAGTYGLNDPSATTSSDLGGIQRAPAGTTHSPSEGFRSEPGLKDTVSRETSSLKSEASAAKESIKDSAAHFASSAKDRAFEEAERGKETVSTGLEDFAAAIRKASDELGDRDQSMSSNLVREIASGLEQATGSIKGKSVQELTQSVAGFARRQPTAFLIGAALAGVALGRFARASSSGSHDEVNTGSGLDRGSEWNRAPAQGRSSWQDETPAGIKTSPVRSTTPLTGDRPVGQQRPGADDALMGRGSGSFNPGGAGNVG